MKIGNKIQMKAKEIVLRFMRYNQGFVTIILCLTIMTQSLQNRSLTISNEHKDTLLANMANHVTYLSDAGVVKQYEKEKLDVYKELPNVQNVLSSHLIQSAYVLTNDYKKVSFQSSEELFKSSQVFIKFYKEFLRINEKDATEQRKTQFKQVMKDWEQIMTYFKLAINQNNLPHVIDKKESQITLKQWETTNENFEIRFLIPLYATSRNNNNVIDEGVAYAEIEAKGYFNLLEATTLNPRGLKFTYLKLLHPEIDHNKR